jgi:hypothetical protein
MRVRSVFVLAVGVAIGLLGNHLLAPVPASAWDVRADGTSFELEVYAIAIFVFVVVGSVLFLYDLADWYRSRRRMKGH